MRPHAIRSAAVAFLLGLFLHSTPSAAAAPAYPAKAGEVIIKFKSRATLSEQQAILSDLGASDVKDLPRIGAKRARVGRLSVSDAIRRYHGHPKVDFIEPNYIYKASVVPNDPRFAELWALENNGQTGGVPGADIRAPLAWGVTTGSPGVLIAITDSGIDYLHPDLAPNVFTNPGEIPGNGIDDDHNGYVDDVHGWDFVNNDNDPYDDNFHGTHVSGTVGAVGNNGVGVVGVNWNVRILPLKFLDFTGSGTTDAAVLAINYAAAMGVRVINASWGGGGPSEALRLAIQNAGAVFVAAAGNSGSDNDLFPTYPASYDLPNLIAVAATDQFDQVPFWSNYGAHSVHLAAPGDNILSTMPGGYGLLSGTSMAAPHVSGALGLIFARFPGIAAPDARNLLLSHVDALPALAGRVQTGGRLDAFLPIAMSDSIPPARVTNLTAGDADGTRITLHWTATGDDGGVGTAARYEIRYSTSPIDEASFGSATLVPSPPRPQAAGAAEQFQVVGLTFSTTYYIALKARDEFGNASPLSNVASATTLGPPNIGVSPGSLSASLFTGEQATRALTVSNTGKAELHFQIGASAAPAAGGAALAARVRTFVLPPAASAVKSGAEAPAARVDDRPGYPPNRAPYAQGHASPRAAIGPGDIRFTNVFAAGLRVLILRSGGDVSEIQSLLAGFPDLSAVDVFDGTSSVPTLAELTAYQSVIVVDNSPFADPVGVGNVLADYVDGGGGVVLTLATFISGWDIRGRFQSGGYSPFTLGTGPNGSSTLGSYNASHPIMAGVTAAAGDLLGDVGLAGGSELVASWLNGEPFVATKGRVSAVNIFVGATGFWTGAIPLLLHNAAFWGGGVSWLSSSPTSGVVPAGSQLGVVVTFDASGLDGGDYGAAVTIKSDDPDQGQIDIPASLHVTGRPDIAVQGDSLSVESTRSYSQDGALTTHHLITPVTPGGAGVVELVANGDYGDPGETATASAEGLPLGSVGSSGADCTPAQGSFPLDAPQLASLVADGAVDVMVQNSPFVGAICPLNQHTVRLRYTAPGDHLDFGQVFVGGTSELGLTIRNTGSLVLNVSSVSADEPAFTPDQTTLTVPPHGYRRLVVRFHPESVRGYAGTLTVSSDDPDEGQITISLAGEGVTPPDISVAPTEVAEDLFTGGVKSRFLTLSNLGGSDLDFRLHVEGVPGVVARVAAAAAHEARGETGGPMASWARALARPSTGLEARPGPGVAGAQGRRLPGEQEVALQSGQAPASYHATPLAPSVMSGATVLLIEDALPWGTMANEAVLAASGLAFDVILSTQLASTDLTRYQKVIVASDQSTFTYSQLASRAAQFDQYVSGGGTLEFHAAGWGWQSGDASLVTLPGGMQIVFGLSPLNDVLDPAHPLMAGVPDPFTGSSASHSYFSAIPAGATQLVADDQGRINFVVYSFGHGHVIAGGQTFEYGYANGQGAGVILGNMIPYGLASVARWLTASPDSGRVGAGGSQVLTLRLDAAGLASGDYQAVVVVDSNDPDEAEVRVPVQLHVTGAADIAVLGDSVSVESTQSYQGSGALTRHHLVVTEPAAGDGLLELEANGDYGDFTETATVTLEGLRLGEVGRTGLDCSPARGSFAIAAADLARLMADGAVDAEVQNSPDVNEICAVNSHRVRLSYRRPADALDFGPLFVGLCHDLTVEVQNHGTDVLHVGPLALAGFQVSPAAGFSVAPGGQQPLTLTFCPTAPGPVQGTLAIRSDDPDEPEVDLTVRGLGVIPPDIAVTPSQLADVLLPDQTVTQRLLIADQGGYPLTFEIRIGESASAAAGSSVARTSARPTESSAEALAAARDRYRAFTQQGGPTAKAAAGGRVIASAALAPGIQSLTIFSDDMEHGVGGWIHYTTHADSIDLWAQTTERAASGTTSWHVSQHGYVGSDALQSPVIDLGAYPQAALSFLHWYNFDDCGGDPTFEPDGAIVEVSEAGTGVWQQIFPVSGYPYVLDDICGNPLAFRQAYSHDSPGGSAFVADTFDLTPFAGKRIYLRFRAGWDCGNCEFNEGWYIDDVRVYSDRPNWVRAAPALGSVLPGDVLAVDVTFEATGLAPGAYLAQLLVNSNDPDKPQVVVPVRLQVADLSAELDVDPSTINLGRRGNVLTCYLECAGLDPATIDVGSLRFNGLVPAEPSPTSIGDHDQDGIPDRMIKFDFDAVRPTLVLGPAVRTTVTGIVGGSKLFLGVGFPRVIGPQLLAPNGGGVVAARSTVTISWETPAQPAFDHADLFFSCNAGVSWSPITVGVHGSSFAWSVPAVSTRYALVRVDIHDDAGLLLSDVSDGEFEIQDATTAVNLAPDAPTERVLFSAPNPFSGLGGTGIHFALPTPGFVEVTVHDIAGQRVRVLTRGLLAAGRQEARWDGCDDHGVPLGPGVYFVRLRSPQRVVTTRVALLR